jgi:hypothetical protein
LLVLDTEKNPPLSVRFSDLLRYPGIAFRIAIEGDRDEEAIMDNFETTLNQAEYPLAHFTDLSKILIHADNPNLAKKLAKGFLEREAGRNWLNGTRQLLLVSGKNGIIDPASAICITKPDYFDQPPPTDIFTSNNL